MENGYRMESSFPVLDISYITQTYDYENINVQEFASDVKVIMLSKEFVKLIAQFGFLYVKGSLFTEANLDLFWRESRSYFALPTEEKMKSALMPNGDANNAGQI